MWAGPQQLWDGIRFCDYRVRKGKVSSVGIRADVTCAWLNEDDLELGVRDARLTAWAAELAASS